MENTPLHARLWPSDAQDDRELWVADNILQCSGIVKDARCPATVSLPEGEDGAWSPVGDVPVVFCDKHHEQGNLLARAF